jgi:TPR repeat protein
MGTSASATADVSASSVFSASVKASSSKLASHRDGDPQACAQADPLADAPAAACAAPVRLELWSIARGQGSSTPPSADDAAGSCPKGSVYRSGKCTPSTGPLDPCFTLAYEGCDQECSAGNLDACERAADSALHAALGSHSTDDLTFAARLYEKTCAAGNPIGCNQRGYMHAHGMGGPKNDVAAASLYDKSCLAGNEQACNNLAYFYEDGRGVKADPAQAIALYKRACNGGRAVACGNLGVMYQRGHGVPADVLAASVFYKRACDGLDGPSCWRLAVMLLDHDPPSAARAAKRGASTGDPSSADLYGKMLEEGKAGLTADPKAAASLYETACGEGNSNVDETDPDGCTRLGYLYAHGTGVAQDVARGAALYKLGCDRNDGGGCNELGLLTLDGNGAPKDPKAAAQLFARSCKLEDAGGCGNLGQAKELGRGVPRDAAGAVTLYRTACKAGDGWSCDQLKRLGKAP